LGGGQSLGFWQLSPDKTARPMVALSIFAVFH
jgi:hypothetical protein